MKRPKKPLLTPKPGDLCPICGQFMDLFCTGYRNIPFVDYKTYPKMCFGCFNVPKTERQKNTEDGVEITELSFSPKHLHRASELLLMGCVSTKEQAKKCVNGVKEAIAKAKIPRKLPVLREAKSPDIVLNPNAPN